jgi:hypothetical protein
VNRQDVTLTIVFNVDADAAALLQGFAGQAYLYPDGEVDVCEPISGIELLAYGACERVVDALTAADLFPAALDAERIGIGVKVNRPYADAPIDF